MRPGIHHGDPVRGLGDDPHVVGHEHDRGAVIPAEALQQADDLRLDGDVEGRGGLVGDDEPGVHGERESDHDALAHAAGELMGELIDAALRRRDADLVEQLDGPQLCATFVDGDVGADSLDELLAHRVQRVQRCQRILKHHGDLIAPQPPHLLVAEIVNAASVRTISVPGPRSSSSAADWQSAAMASRP